MEHPFPGRLQRKGVSWQGLDSPRSPPVPRFGECLKLSRADLWGIAEGSGRDQKSRALSEQDPEPACSGFLANPTFRHLLCWGWDCLPWLGGEDQSCSGHGPEQGLTLMVASARSAWGRCMFLASMLSMLWQEGVSEGGSLPSTASRGPCSLTPGSRFLCVLHIPTLSSLVILFPASVVLCFLVCPSTLILPDLLLCLCSVQSGSLACALVHPCCPQIRSCHFRPLLTPALSSVSQDSLVPPDSRGSSHPSPGAAESRPSDKALVTLAHHKQCSLLFPDSMEASSGCLMQQKEDMWGRAPLAPPACPLTSHQRAHSPPTARWEDKD